MSLLISCEKETKNMPACVSIGPVALQQGECDHQSLPFPTGHTLIASCQQALEMH